MNARTRPAFYALLTILAVWLVTLAGYALSNHYKVTAEKLRAYLQETDLRKLSGADRARALKKLADKINSLSADERREARLGKLWNTWFNEMTDQEKSDFLEATLPSGFKQALDSFEQLPPEKRKKAIDDAMRQLKEAREASPEEFAQKSQRNGTNNPVLSEELQKQVAMIGLKSVYGSGSAETKAELAPVLEEIQKNMETGRMFRAGR